MTVTPTGRAARIGDSDALVIERTFTAPIESVWAAVTESQRLERWIGTWTGDPRDGYVMFTMNAEPEAGTPNRHDIDTCEPPRRLVVRSVDDFGTWHLTAELSQAGPTTTLRFTQLVEDPSIVEATGPGWEWYLDRLVAAETGVDPATLDWAEYETALTAHYKEIAASFAR